MHSAEVHGKCLGSLLIYDGAKSIPAASDCAPLLWASGDISFVPTWISGHVYWYLYIGNLIRTRKIYHSTSSLYVRLGPVALTDLDPLLANVAPGFSTIWILGFSLSGLSRHSVVCITGPKPNCPDVEQPAAASMSVIDVR